MNRLISLIKPVIEKIPLLAVIYRQIRDLIVVIFIRLFLNLIRLSFSVIKPESTLTCFSGTDGGGAQLQRIMSVASLAHFLGIKFLYTPINEIFEYTIPKNFTKVTYIDKWNTLINFYEVYQVNHIRTIKVQGLLKTIFSSVSKKNFALTDAHLFADVFPNAYKDLIISKPLYIMPKSYNSFSNCNSNASIHFRVPTTPKVHPEYVNEQRRLLSYFKFNKAIDQIKLENNISDSCIRILLYNANYLESNFIAHVSKFYFDDQTEATEAIQIMSNSDVVLVSYSSMSYLAALFNNN